LSTTTKTATSRFDPASPPPRIVYILGALLLSAILCLSGLGSRDLWDPDETRYAAVAQTMMLRGDWIVPHINGTIYAEKPPLSFWLMAGCFKLFGTNETAARLPSALAGILTTLAVFLLAERCFGVRGGFIAGVAAATAPALTQLSRWAIMEPMLTLCIVLASYFLFVGVEETPRRRFAFPVAGLAMGAGLLIKGPPALLPILVILVYAAVTRQIGAAANRYLLLGLAIAAVIAAGWIVPACIRGGPAYTREILFHQTVGRFAKGWIHQKPAYYYLYALPGMLMPWALFLPSAVVMIWRGRATTAGNSAVWRGAIFALVWIAVFGLFFSTSKSKKALYVLPTVPAAAVLVGGLFAGSRDETERTERTPSRALRLRPSAVLRTSSGQAWFSTPIVLTSAAVILLAAALPVAAHRYLHEPMGKFAPLILLAGGLAIVSLVAAYLALKGRHISAFATLALALAGLNLILPLAALEMLDSRKSAKDFASRTGYISQGARLATFGLRPQSFIFYGRRETGPRLWTAAWAARFLRSPGKRYLALPEKDVNAMPHDLGVVVFSGQAWGKGAALIANLAAAEDASARIRARQGEFLR